MRVGLDVLAVIEEAHGRLDSLPWCELHNDLIDSRTIVSRLIDAAVQVVNTGGKPESIADLQAALNSIRSQR